MDEGEAAVRADRDDGLTRVTGLLAALGGVLVLVVACFVAASVTWRALTSGVITGVVEIVEIATALAVFAFLPLCQARRGNVVVDTFTQRLPPRVVAGLDALWDLVYAGVAGVLAWQLSLGARDTLASRTTSMTLGLPTGWAIAACAAMAGLLAIVAVLTAGRLVRSGR